MNTTDPIPTLEAEITAPDLATSATQKNLDELRRVADRIRSHEGVGGQADAEDTINIRATQLVDFLGFDQQRQLGRTMAMALLSGSMHAARDAAFLYVRAQQNAQHMYHFLDILVATLRDDGRLDLVRPGLLLLHRECSAHWDAHRAHRHRVRAELFPDGAPAWINDTPNIPEHFDRVLATTTIVQAQNARQRWQRPTRDANDQSVERSDPADGLVGWNGALAWQALARGMQNTLSTLSDIQINGAGVLTHMRMMGDVVTTIPAARSWGAALAMTSISLALALALGTDLDADDALFRRQAFRDGVVRLLRSANAEESRSLLGSIALIRTNVQDKSDIFRWISELAHVVVDNHPQISLDEWARGGDPLLIQQGGYGPEKIRQLVDRWDAMFQEAEKERARTGASATDRVSNKAYFSQDMTCQRALLDVIQHRDRLEIRKFAVGVGEIVRMVAAPEDVVSQDTGDYWRKIMRFIDWGQTLSGSDPNILCKIDVLGAMADRSDLRRGGGLAPSGDEQIHGPDRLENTTHGGAGANAPTRRRRNV